MNRIVQERHREPVALAEPRPLVVACPPMRSNVNLSRIARAAGCCGVQRMICCGTGKLITKIARDAPKSLALEVHRTLPPVLERLRREGFRLIGLEQTSGSQPLYEFRFPRKTVLVLGNERAGLEDALLGIMDDLVEIPVYGLPYSHNVATAATMALYEYCRQYPAG